MNTPEIWNWRKSLKVLKLKLSAVSKIWHAIKTDHQFHKNTLKSKYKTMQ